MAVSNMAKILVKLIGKHGFTRGIKMAKNMGFESKDIQKAVKQITSNVTKRQNPKTSPMGATAKEQAYIAADIDAKTRWALGDFSRNVSPIQQGFRGAARTRSANPMGATNEQQKRIDELIRKMEEGLFD